LNDTCYLQSKHGFFCQNDIFFDRIVLKFMECSWDKVCVHSRCCGRTTISHIWTIWL